MADQRIQINQTPPEGSEAQSSSIRWYMRGLAQELEKTILRRPDRLELTKMLGRLSQDDLAILGMIEGIGERVERVLYLLAIVMVIQIGVLVGFILAFITFLLKAT